MRNWRSFTKFSPRIQMGKPSLCQQWKVVIMQHHLICTSVQQNEARRREVSKWVLPLRFPSRQRMITQFMGHSGIQKKMHLNGRGLIFRTLHRQSRPPSTWLNSLSVKVWAARHYFWFFNWIVSSCMTVPFVMCKSGVVFSPRSQEELSQIWIRGGGEQSADIQPQSCLHWAPEWLWANIFFLMSVYRALSVFSSWLAFSVISLVNV